MDPISLMAISVEAISTLHKVLTAVEHVRTPFPLTAILQVDLPVLGAWDVKVTFTPTADPAVSFSKGEHK